jgi:hypothetical protein
MPLGMLNAQAGELQRANLYQAHPTGLRGCLKSRSGSNFMPIASP